MVSRWDAAASELHCDASIAPGGPNRWIMEDRMTERRWLVTVARMCLAAGMAEQQAMQADVDAGALVGVLLRAMDRADLDEDAQIRLRDGLMTELLSLEQTEQATVSGMPQPDTGVARHTTVQSVRIMPAIESGPEFPLDGGLA
jgi:hypothetical protein